VGERNWKCNELDILRSNVVVSESIWREDCGVGNGIKQKDDGYTAESIECGAREIGSATQLDIPHCNLVVSENIWGQ
jgi:hypothetical protein